jgi:hypothetical protein
MSGTVDAGQVEFFEAVVDRDTDDSDLGRIDIVATTRYGDNVIRRVPPLFPPFFCGRPNVDDTVTIMEFPGGQMFYLTRSSVPHDWMADVNRVGFGSRSGDVQVGIQSDKKEVRLGSFDATQMATIWEPLKVILQAIITNLGQLNSHTQSIPTGGVIVAPDPITGVLTNANPVVVPAPSGCSYGVASTDTNADKPGSDVVRLIKDKPNG